LGLVHPGELAQSRSCVPVHWLPLRSHWSPMGRTHRRSVHCRGHDHLLNRSQHEHLYLWYGVCRNGRRSQRTHCSRRNFRAGTNEPAWQVCRYTGFHDYSFLPFGALWSVDRLLLLMAMDRLFLRYLGFHWTCHHRLLLFPATSRQQPGPYAKASAR
jgi:hypothetical protein